MATQHGAPPPRSRSRPPRRRSRSRPPRGVTKSLASAEKTYKKALKKAGKNKSKKAKAKKAYAKKRATAKATYKKAIAPTRRLATKPQVQNRPIVMALQP
ncbi:hypothetical protein [Aeromicrobium sp. UC242_57]|uniref:hypothetical protein n=1 Tax=Aeromicrobium sp. UC242_57 TaxID=3374624 RepID=UPI0037ADFD95